MTNLHFRKITLDRRYGESIREGGWRKDTLGNLGKEWELSKGVVEEMESSASVQEVLEK